MPATSSVLMSEPATDSERCRCGSRLSVGGTCWRFAAAPEPLATLLQEVSFCSAGCAQAWLLESLELFEGSAAASVVSDVEAVLSGLRKLYGLLVATAS